MFGSFGRTDPIQTLPTQLHVHSWWNLHQRLKSDHISLPRPNSNSRQFSSLIWPTTLKWSSSEFILWRPKRPRTCSLGIIRTETIKWERHDLKQRKNIQSGPTQRSWPSKVFERDEPTSHSVIISSEWRRRAVREREWRWWVWL